MTTITTAPGLTADAYAAKLFGAVLGAFETLSVYAGDRLGWFTSLATDGPATSSELAQGSEDHVRELFGDRVTEVRAEKCNLRVTHFATPR